MKEPEYLCPTINSIINYIKSEYSIEDPSLELMFDSLRTKAANLREWNKPKEVVTEEKADRFNNGKLKWSLIDFKSLEPLVRVMEYGAKKYSKDNWKKGLKPNEILESLARHLFALLDGEMIDEESKCLHIGHIMANAMICQYTLNIFK